MTGSPVNILGTMIAVWLKVLLLLSLLYITTAFYVYRYGGPGKLLTKTTIKGKLRKKKNFLYVFPDV